VRETDLAEVAADAVADFKGERAANLVFGIGATTELVATNLAADLLMRTAH
jgi:hypothetical protein